MPDLLDVLMRWLHLAGVALLVGGLGFVVLCASPAKRWLEKEEDALLLRKIETRFRFMLGGAIGAIVIAGIYNWMMMALTYQSIGSVIHILIGIKITLAVILIALLWAQDIGMMVAPGARTWRIICLVLAFIVMILGATVRQIRLEALDAMLAAGGS